MYNLFTVNFGGLICFAASLALGCYLIFWGGKRNIKCPSCRQFNPKQASYCARCGTKLSP